MSLTIGHGLVIAGQHDVCICQLCLVSPAMCCGLFFPGQGARHREPASGCCISVGSMLSAGG